MSPLQQALSFAHHHAEVVIIALVAALKGIEWLNLPAPTTVLLAATMGFMIGRLVNHRLKHR